MSNTPELSWDIYMHGQSDLAEVRSEPKDDLKCPALLCWKSNVNGSMEGETFG